VARFGGDDFAVLLPEISGSTEARRLDPAAGRAAQLVVGGIHACGLRVNAGIALARPRAGSRPELMRNADVAK
jgi:GGDEF domain-containing protein